MQRSVLLPTIHPFASDPILHQRCKASTHRGFRRSPRGILKAINARSSLPRLSCLRSNPNASVRAFTLSAFGLCLFWTGRYPEAIAVLKEEARLLPDYPPSHAGLVASLARSEAFSDARKSLARLNAQVGIEVILPICPDPILRSSLLSGIALTQDVSP